MNNLIKSKPLGIFFIMGIILFFPLTVYSYVPMGFSLGYILIIVQLIIAVFFNIMLKNTIKFNYFYFIFLSILFLSSVIGSLIASSNANYVIVFFLRAYLVYIYLICVSPFINLSLFLKVYEFFGFFVMLYLYVQLFLYHVLGIFIRANPLRIPLSQTNDMDLVTSSNLYIFRPASIFLEPGWYSVFILVLFVIYLSKKKFILAAITFFSMVLATSSLGIATAIIIVLYFSLSRKIQLKYKISIVIVAISGIVFFMSSPLLAQAFSRIQSSGGSLGQRLLRGFEIIPQLRFPDFITGVGFGNLGNYLEQYKITTSNDFGIPIDYMNSFMNMYISGGIVGFLSFIFIIFKYFMVEKRDLLFDLFNVMVLTQLIASSVFNGGIWLIYITFYLLYFSEVKHQGTIYIHL